MGRVIFRAMEATAVSDFRRVIKVGNAGLDLLAEGNTGARGVMGVLSRSQAVVQLCCVGHTHLIASVAELSRLPEGDHSRLSGRRIALT